MLKNQIPTPVNPNPLLTKEGKAYLPPIFYPLTDTI